MFSIDTVMSLCRRVPFSDHLYFITLVVLSYRMHVNLSRSSGSVQVIFRGLMGYTTILIKASVTSGGTFLAS
jgi:hypothetical protein